MKNILLDTVFFPTSYATWRMVEIKSFIEHYKCDIGVLSVWEKYKDLFPWDYNECKSFYHLEDYNIIIFQKKYNYLNKFNVNFNGTFWNLQQKNEKLFPYCYMFVRKDRSLSKRCTIDFNTYDFIYHIFLNNFYFFNNLVKFPYEKQGIRLYPGGGVEFNMDNINLDKKIKLITTNLKVTEIVKRSNLTNFVELLCGPMINKDEIIQEKKKKEGKLNILFSTAGGYPKKVYEKKGYFKYIELIKYIKSIGKFENFNFYCVGKIENEYKYNSLGIIYTGLLLQKEFDNLLKDKIDITINLHNGGTDGFPQGMDALIFGCVGILNDPNNFNEKTGINFINEEEMYLVPSDIPFKNLYNIIESLNKDREKLLKMSNLSQKKIWNQCCYKKQFEDGVFKFLNI